MVSKVRIYAPEESFLETQMSRLLHLHVLRPPEKVTQLHPKGCLQRACVVGLGFTV